MSAVSSVIVIEANRSTARLLQVNFATIINFSVSFLVCCSSAAQNRDRRRLRDRTELHGGPVRGRRHSAALLRRVRRWVRRVTVTSVRSRVAITKKPSPLFSRIVERNLRSWRNRVGARDSERLATGLEIHYLVAVCTIPSFEQAKQTRYTTPRSFDQSAKQKFKRQSRRISFEILIVFKCKDRSVREQSGRSCLTR